jgi:hypothetical protein
MLDILVFSVFSIIIGLIFLYNLSKIGIFTLGEYSRWQIKVKSNKFFFKHKKELEKMKGDYFTKILLQHFKFLDNNLLYMTIIKLTDDLCNRKNIYADTYEVTFFTEKYFVIELDISKLHLLNEENLDENILNLYLNLFNKRNGIK